MRLSRVVSRGFRRDLRSELFRCFGTQAENDVFEKWLVKARKEAGGKDPFEVFGATNMDVSGRCCCAQHCE